MVLSADELASIRADAAAVALDLSCDIQRKTTRTKDGIGSSSDTWTTVATVQAGMTEPSGTDLQNYDYLIGSKAAWQIRLPYGTDVRIQDTLVIKGQSLEVQIILDPRSYAALLSVLATEIQGVVE